MQCYHILYLQFTWEAFLQQHLKELFCKGFLFCLIFFRPVADHPEIIKSIRKQTTSNKK